MLVKLEALCVAVATTVAVTGVVDDTLISHQLALAGAAADCMAALVFAWHRLARGHRSA